MDKDNLVLYNVLMYQYNQAFRRKYRINTIHWNILSTIYYMDLTPPRGAYKNTIRTLNRLYHSNHIDKMLQELRDRSMIQYDKQANKRFIIHLLPHVREDMNKLYSLSNIESYIKGRMSKY